MFKMALYQMFQEWSQAELVQALEDYLIYVEVIAEQLKQRGVDNAMVRHATAISGDYKTIHGD
jgi:hypothetical protein